MATTTLVIVRGETAELRFTAFRAGGDPDELLDRIDLTGFEARFAMKENAVDSAYEIRKNSTANPADVIIDTQSGATLGQYSVFLRPTDTNDGATPLPLGSHVFDSWVDDGTDRFTVAKLQPLRMIREVDDLENP